MSQHNRLARISVLCSQMPFYGLLIGLLLGAFNHALDFESYCPHCFGLLFGAVLLSFPLMGVAAIATGLMARKEASKTRQFASSNETGIGLGIILVLGSAVLIFWASGQQ